MTHLFPLLSELWLNLAPTHVNGRFPSDWKGAGSNFKCALRVSSSPVADTVSLLSSCSNNLYNISICEVWCLWVLFWFCWVLFHTVCIMQKSNAFASWLCLYMRVGREFNFTSTLLQRMEETLTENVMYKYTKINHCLPGLYQASCY